MAKQSYLQQDIRNGIYRNFIYTYRKMLIQHVFKDEKAVDMMLADKKANRLLAQVIEKSFKDEECEGFIKQYERITGDTCLRTYIDIYKSYIDETSYTLYDDAGNFYPDCIDEYFSVFNPIINNIYKTLEKDCEEGFYWWKKDDATALRRQLGKDIMFFNDNKMNSLCKKYLNHPYDFNKSCDTKYNLSLINKLDAIMEKNGAQVKYVWKETDAEGNIRKIESAKAPKDVPYYITVYKSLENERRM